MPLSQHGESKAPRPHGVIEIRAPATISDAELKPIVRKLVDRVEKREAKKALNDADLERWARSLNKRFFAGRLRWTSIVWVTNQRNRVGDVPSSLRLANDLKHNDATECLRGALEISEK